ncbi:hypothetical protein F2P81_006878 [Scophthalmus maximus]|uniref:Uncharacterized protein n=1 Tax=Scophthalmus maximus TaxID=52904 RepID=A0A6A4TAT7_SCOMX|nr:hypothetical protein F2P81_006878 [Scophthalmus maximus]
MSFVKGKTFPESINDRSANWASYAHPTRNQPQSDWIHPSPTAGSVTAASSVSTIQGKPSLRRIKGRIHRSKSLDSIDLLDSNSYSGLDAVCVYECANGREKGLRNSVARHVKLPLCCWSQ